MAVYHNNNGDLELIAGSTNYQFCPIGSILPFGGLTPPNGFFLCQGQALNRNEYKELFGVIGTRFGVGDSSTTFNLPDLRGEFLRGAGVNSHSGQGNGSAVGTHQDATNQVVLTPWGNQLYFELGAVPSNFDTMNYGPTYQYLQNEAGHTDTQSVYQTMTARPTNTSVNYIIKAKVVGDESDDLTIVDSAQNNNMNPITSNAVYKNWKQEYGQAIAVTLSSGSGADMFTTMIETAMTMKDGNGVNHNLGTGGSHRFHVAWTTEGYLLFIIDVTVVAAIRGGTILTNLAN